MIERRWNINFKIHKVEFDEDSRLLDVLRETLNLTGTKEGCGEGECGACSVLINNVLKLSCLILAATLPDNTEIITIEGIGNTDLGRRIQKAFLKVGAVQCGFCTPGMIIATYYLLKNFKRPDTKTIRTALSGNLCRCTGYQMIFEAVQLATRRR